MAPFSVGKHGDWRVHARGVEAIHLYLCFDGERAYVAAASEQARVFVPGAQVGGSWVPIVVPSRLWFGTACIVIQAQSSDKRPTSERPLRVFAAGTVRLPDFSQADEPQTRILDLGAAALRKTQRFDTPESMLALLREAGREPQNVAPQMPAVGGAAAHSGATAPSRALPERIEPASNGAGHATAVLDLARTVPSFEPVPVATTTVIFSSPSSAPVAPDALTSTLYDGGRLRDYAARLAANTPPPTGAAAPAPSAATSGAEASVSSQPPVELSSRRSKAKPGHVALALRISGLCLGLLGIAGVWSRQQSAKANPSPPHVAAAAPGGPALAATPAPAAHPAPPTAPRPHPPAERTASGTAGSALVAPALSTARRDVSAAPSPAPSLSAVSSSPAAPTSNAAQPPASAGATHAAVASESADLASTEHAAFAAAFSGNDSSAAALYAKLAADSHSRTFELAARLAREGRIRKP
jgi:hypothetical protein